MKISLEELLKKYNQSGPRYTSYPTVPAWTNKVEVSDYENSLRDVRSDENLSLYFHLPFCENLCHFCGCMQVITKDHSRSQAYTDTICQELEQVSQCLSQESRVVSQVHFGGGTPNFLKPQELSQILSSIHRHFNLLKDAEIAIEMHPRTSTSEFCENLKKEGFNRISLGVQDFDPHVQKLINRHQSYEMTETMLQELRHLGFDSFNFDLVYGLPGQTEKGWLRTLDQVLELSPDRLAVYSYAHVPWMRPVQRTFKDEDLPSPAQKVDFFIQAYQTFLKSGYQLIGMDHFAKENDDLAKALQTRSIHRNFMGYSTKSDAHQLGFGVSAISYVNGNYFQNEKKLSDYEAAIKSKVLATFRGLILDHEDHLRRDLITRIMCHAYIDIIDFESKWNIQFHNKFADAIKSLQVFVQDDLLKLNNKEFKVVGEGFLVLRNMAMCFDPYLSKIQASASNPTFSKTI